jgi:hypothetical protein
MRRNASVTALLVLAASAVSSPAVIAQSHTRQNGGAEGTQDAPQELLKNCVLYAHSLNPTDRAFLMVRVAETAARHGYPQSTLWSRQAFVIATSLPKDWNRMALQKNALRALAKTRPKEALHLLGTLQGPDFTYRVRIPEDPRASAAIEIFVGAYERDGKASLDAIDEVSRIIGQTGEYPYLAWGRLLPTFLALDSDEVRRELRTAIYFYSRAENRIRSEDAEFLEMIEDVQSVAGSNEMRDAVEAGIHRLESEKSPDNETFLAKTDPSETRAVFNDRNKALMYRWLPLAQKFAPEQYKSVADKLKVQPQNRQQPPVSVEIIGDKNAISAASHQRSMDRVQKELVVREAATAPELAFSDADKIDSIAIRSETLSEAATSISNEHSPWRQKFLRASRSALDHAQEKDASYFHALADLAMAYDHLGMRDEAFACVQSGLDIGVEIVSESSDEHPTTATMLLDGYSDLAQLVTVGMHINPRMVLRAIRNVPNRAVKANLMVDVAHAVASGPEQPA